MHNSMMLFTFFHFRLEIIPFLDKFGSKNQNNQFKLKFGNYIDSNMQNSMVIFTFSVCDRKYPFWVNLIQKVKINSLSWNMIPTLIRIRRIQWRCSLYAEFNHAENRLKIPFLGKFGPKNQDYQFKLKFGTYFNSNI